MLVAFNSWRQENEKNNALSGVEAFAAENWH